MFQSLFRKLSDEHNLKKGLTLSKNINLQQQRQKIKFQSSYKYPASIQSALIHQNASKFGYRILSKDQNILLCPCCDLEINNVQIPLCYSTSSLNQQLLDSQQLKYLLPPGIALFFSFIKALIFYLILRLIILDLASMWFSYQYGNICQDNESSQNQLNKCSKTIITLTSSYNRINKQDYIIYQDLLNLLIVILSIIYFSCYRRWQYYFYDLVDCQVHTEDDYSIFLENIPILDFSNFSTDKQTQQFHYKRHLTQFFQDKIKNWLSKWQQFEYADQNTIQYNLYHTINKKQPSNSIVRSVSLCYNVSQIEQIKLIKQGLMEKYLNQQNFNQQFNILFEENKYNTIQGQIQYLNECELEKCKNFATNRSAKFSISHFVGIGFISFQYQHYRQYIMRQYEKKKNFLNYYRENMGASRAPHPQDIIWKNLHITKKQRLIKIFTTFLVLLMTLFFCFGLILFITIYRKRKQVSIIYQKKQQQPWSVIQRNIFTFISTIVTLLINYLLYIIVQELTQLQRHRTRTHYLTSFLIKLLVCQFINTSVLYYAIWQVTKIQILSSLGLVNQVTYLVIYSGIIQIFTNIFDYNHYIRQFKLWWKYRNLSIEDSVNNFQIYLNKQYQYVEFDFAYRYSYYLLQIYTGFFYSHLTPLVIPILVIIFIIQYWIDKYTLFKRSSLKYYDINFFLPRVVLIILQISLLIFTIGNLIFSWGKNTKNNIIGSISVLISFIYVLFILLLPQTSKRKIFSTKQNFQQYTYMEAYKKGCFIQRYWKRNPATKLTREQDMVALQYQWFLNYQNLNSKNQLKFGYQQSLNILGKKTNQ